MKKILSTLLVLAMVLMSMCAVAVAEEPMTINIMTYKHTTMPLSDDYLTLLALEEKFNVDFVFDLTVNTDYTEKLNTVLAGGDLPDVFAATTADMAQYYETGFIRVLDELLAEKAPNVLAAYEAAGVTKNAKADDGHYYYIASIDESAALECCGWINADWMAECGLEMPTTYDELYEVLKVFKATYGEDCIPMSNGPWYNVPAHIYLAHHTYNNWVWFGEEEGYAYGPYTYADGMKAALTYMNKLYEEGLLDAEYLTRSADDINAKAGESKIGYFVTWADHAAAIAEGGTLGCNYVPVPALEGTTGANKVVMHKNAINTPMFIPASTSDEVVDKFLEIVNYIYSEEGQILMDFGIEGDTYTMVDGVPTLTDKVMKHEVGALNGRRSFGMEPQNFPHIASWEGWSAVLLPPTVEVTNANTEFVLPQQPSLTGTFEEDSELATIMGDINTLTNTTLTAFIVGEKDIETEWDAYIQQLKDMGIERAIEINNAKYDRWLAR